MTSSCGCVCADWAARGAHHERLRDTERRAGVQYVLLYMCYSKCATLYVLFYTMLLYTCCSMVVAVVVAGAGADDITAPLTAAAVESTAVKAAAALLL